MIMNRTHVLLLAAVVFSAAGTAQAGTAHITGGGFDFLMDSADMPGTISDAGSHWLSGPELRSLHTSLNSAGVATDGVVTFVLANTDAGLSIYALVDNNAIAGAGAIDAMLGMSSTTVATAGYVMNDMGDDLQGYSNGGSTQTIFGDYFWHPDGGADGMAWTGLNAGDTGTFDFQAYMGESNEAAGGSFGDGTTFAGINPQDSFQFISWNGQGWETVMTGSFDEGGAFSFAFAIVPVPPAVALGLAGLGAVAIVRKRRKKA
jgi:hypothetical protein